MKKQKKTPNTSEKNILICVTGLSPQIVTETVFTLYKEKKIAIDKIICVTTSDGKTCITNYYKDFKKTDGPYSLKKELEDMCKLYKIPLPAFEEDQEHIIVTKEETIEKPDIWNNKDNELFANEICSVIKKYTEEPGNTLYCSLSGGRKTMSAYMYAAMTLFGREKDLLFHVLVDKEFEISRKFYPEAEDKVGMVLSEVPYIKLRTVITDIFKKNFSYSDLIIETQKKIEQIDYGKLIVDRKVCKLKYCDSDVTLSYDQILLYTAFVKRKNMENNFYTQQEVGFGKEDENKAYTLVEAMLNEQQEIEEKTLKDILKRRNYNYNDKEQKSVWWNRGKRIEDFRTEVSKIKSQLKELFNGYNEKDELISKFTISNRGKKENKEYFIKADISLLKII
jgi:CRISPR-associated protein (TIGR02584 family)